MPVNKSTLTIGDFRFYMARASTVFQKAIGYSLLETMQIAERKARQNIRTNFKGKHKDASKQDYQYTLSGALFNSVYSRFEDHPREPTGVLGSKGVVYARIHELGGTIKNKNWKYLWLRQKATIEKGSMFRRLKPAEFWELAQVDSDYFYYQKNGKLFAAVKTWGGVVNLFNLRKKVEIPARPYLRPALVSAGERFPGILRRWVIKLGKEK